MNATTEFPAAVSDDVRHVGHVDTTQGGILIIDPQQLQDHTWEREAAHVVETFINGSDSDRRDLYRMRDGALSLINCIQATRNKNRAGRLPGMGDRSDAVCASVPGQQWAPVYATYVDGKIAKLEIIFNNDFVPQTPTE